MKQHRYFVYILSNKNRTVLYTGVTNNLCRRCEEHKSRKSNGFSKKYNVDELVYYEEFKYINDAIKREKHIKTFSRKKKDDLIAGLNPTLIELAPPG